MGGVSKLASLRPNVSCLLVVDDEPDIVESLKDVFEASLPGVKVLTALNGKKGLELLKKEEVDLVLSDYKMPVMDGLEFLTKASQVAPQVPRILLTAYPELNVAVRAINEAAISNFLTKPISPEALMEAVNAALIKAKQGGVKTTAPSPAP